MAGRSELIRLVKGMRDLLPPETALWQRVEEQADLWTFLMWQLGMLD